MILVTHTHTHFLNITNKPPGTLGANLPSEVGFKWRDKIRKFFRKRCAHCGDKAKRPWHVNLKIFRLCKKCGDVWDLTQKLPSLSLEEHNKVMSKFDSVLKKARLKGRHCQWWHVYIREEAKRIYENSTAGLDVELQDFASADDEEEEEEEVVVVEEKEEEEMIDIEKKRRRKRKRKKKKEDEDEEIIEIDDLKHYSSDETFEENEKLWRPGENVVWVNRRNGEEKLRWSKMKYGIMLPERETNKYYIARTRNGRFKKMMKTDIVSWRMKYAHWRGDGPPLGGVEERPYRRKANSPTPKLGLWKFSDSSSAEETTKEVDVRPPLLQTDVATKQDVFDDDDEIDIEEKVVEKSEQSQPPPPETNDDDDEEEEAPVFIPPPQPQDPTTSKRSKPTCALGVRVKFRATDHEDTWMIGMIIGLSEDSCGTKYCDVLLDSGSCVTQEESKLYLCD